MVRKRPTPPLLRRQHMHAWVCVLGGRWEVCGQRTVLEASHSTGPGTWPHIYRIEHTSTGMRPALGSDIRVHRVEDFGVCADRFLESLFM